ncbi:uncharacterized protein LOC115621823 isoform X2 [Scaptodrosophila lebanonensis]|uniref:Uncharacterized protein LOC115621823 isoform X2 n=1 Tax=Drosophila lebanonensis TaxID=7225 RepID=A0A6J2T3H7_DROLE|nr:uncharacterized protein LOC115621823 isoform X2 [Scaptodrosophila lebanonensis]
MVGKNWKALAHFHRLTEYLVQCKHCDKTLSSKHTSSNLTRHLIRNHKTLARSVFAGEEGRMLAELKEELHAADDNDMQVEMSVGEGETKNAVRTIMGSGSGTNSRGQEPEARNKVIGKNNKLWAHFYRISEFVAKCKHCSKTLSSKHSSSNLMRHIVRRHHIFSKTIGDPQNQPKKDSINIKQQLDPLEKVDFDDVDSIIEKVGDHLEDEEPFYEYVVDNTEEVDAKNGSQPPLTEVHPLETVGDAFMDQTTQLDEKLKAETIYYNEMAELARAKRRLIDLQTKKLLIELNAVDRN